jgi:hypothetical protein
MSRKGVLEVIKRISYINTKKSAKLEGENMKKEILEKSTYTLVFLFEGNASGHFSLFSHCSFVRMGDLQILTF